MRVVIIGATGGIGAAFCKLLATRDNVNTVHALSRTGTGPNHARIKLGTIDLLDEDSIAAAAEAVSREGPPDLVIVATGILSDHADLQPEKSLRRQSRDGFERVFAINTFGPALVAKHFIPIQSKSDRAVFAALSASAATISDNRLGGWHAYRAPNAALNILIRHNAIEDAPGKVSTTAVNLARGAGETGVSGPSLARG